MNTHNRIAKWSVIFGIVIVLNLFFNYALSLAYHRPEFEAYCPSSQVVTMPDTQNKCTSQGGQWTSNPSVPSPKTVSTPATVEYRPEGYCDLQYTCRQNYDAASKIYDRNVFATLVVLGALAVLVGNFFSGNAVISSGLSLAGVLSFIIASMRYWGAANDLMRVLILGIALAILFWIAYKKFNDRVRSPSN